MITASVSKKIKIVKIRFKFKNVPELFTFLPSLLAALFPIKLPVKHRKCLGQCNCSKFSGGGYPSPRPLFKLAPAALADESQWHEYAPTHRKS